MQLSGFIFWRRDGSHNTSSIRHGFRTFYNKRHKRKCLSNNSNALPRPFVLSEHQIVFVLFVSIR